MLESATPAHFLAQVSKAVLSGASRKLEAEPSAGAIVVATLPLLEEDDTGPPKGCPQQYIIENYNNIYYSSGE